MRILAQLFFTFLIASLSTDSFAMKEFPFCPSGGPQGWMNYFEHRRDKNLWRQYNKYQQNQYHQNRRYIPDRYIPETYSPAYNGPAHNGSAYGSPLQQTAPYDN